MLRLKIFISEKPTFYVSSKSIFFNVSLKEIVSDIYVMTDISTTDIKLLNSKYANIVKNILTITHTCDIDLNLKIEYYPNSNFFTAVFGTFTVICGLTTCFLLRRK